MIDIIRDLELKQTEAQFAKDELEGFAYDIREAVAELENYIDEVQSLIDTLSDLPTVSVNVNVDVEFEV